MRTPPKVAMYTYPVSPYMAVKIMLFSLVANIPACGDHPILVNLTSLRSMDSKPKVNDNYFSDHKFDSVTDQDFSLSSTS